jgi:nitrate/TMAO reductase-like tetraheme cytochrome c subunit
LRELPKAVLVVIAVALLAGLGAAAFFGYRTYEYVQHDNDFCLSCHLMVEPYERFAQSEHRDLGCKACHQPTLMVRSKMALTQIIKNPEKLETHAEVPNERCETCHVKGDPKKWEQVANSAGHRVHFESDSSSLKGLKCVECHSTSLHEFAPSDKTCSQSGCHENTKIQLGKMAKLTLHCAVCHEFNRPVAQKVSADSLPGSLQPKAKQCMSCHEMRARIAEQFNGEDPHDAECGACHNPHEQKTPREAGGTCTTCHTAVDSITPMHRGLAANVIRDCMQCHVAHKFEVKSSQCMDCHRSIFNTGPKGRPVAVSREPASKYIHPVALQQPPSQLPAERLGGSPFNHARHRQLKCESCHNSTQTHGAVVIKSAAQCQSCHHGNQAIAANCASCHQPGEYANRAYPMNQRFTFSTSIKQRTANFNHQPHSRVACAQCHRDTLTRSAANLQCNACHADHHKATETCMSCHPTPKAGVHNRNVHVGCGGSGCHSKLPQQILNVPRTRPLCLSCHQNMVNHKPGGNCADCHKLPAPRGGRA